MSSAVGRGVGRGGLAKMLEGHLASKLGKQEAALRHVTTRRPTFPAPSTTSAPTESSNRNAEDEGTSTNVPYVCPGPIMEREAEAEGLTVGSSASEAGTSTTSTSATSASSAGESAVIGATSGAS